MEEGQSNVELFLCHVELLFDAIDFVDSQSCFVDGLEAAHQDEDWEEKDVEVSDQTFLCVDPLILVVGQYRYV